MIEHALRRRGTDAEQQMQQPETSHPVAGVFNEAQQHEHVLDVCNIENLQAAEL